MNRHPLPGLVALLSALAVTIPAHAEVYRCQRDGQAVFTDQPCDGAAPLDLATPTVIAPENGDLARSYDEQVRRGRERRDAADAEWLDQHAERRVTEDRIRHARVNGYVTAGMTPEDVRQVLGEPDRVRGGEGGERWTYQGNGKASSTVVFREGVVLDVQERRAKRR